MAHTPGPWRWEDWNFYGDAVIGPDKQTLTHYDPQDDERSVQILYCEEQPTEDDRSLIAAAPELLAALENAKAGHDAEHREIGGGCDCAPRIITAANAAIAKARGK